MSWMTPREEQFSLSGPFLAKRAGMAGDITLKDGQVYTREELLAAELSDRHIQRMYAAHWLDMASQHEDKLGLLAEQPAETPQEPAAGPEATEVPETPENAPDAPETAPDEAIEPEAAALAAPVEGEEGGAPAQGDAETPPSDTKVAAYKHAGFGKYFPVNAAGEQLETIPTTKSAAEGLAARDQVPLLGQNDPLPGQES